MKPLYEYTNDYKKVIDLIEDAEEITPELMDMLESVSTDSKEKVKNVAAYIKNLELLSEQIDQATKNMIDRQHKILLKAEHMKNYLKHNMEELNLKELNTPEFDIKIRVNNYSLDISDPDLIPREYFKEKNSVNIDKYQIIKDMKNDVLVPGATFVKKTFINIK